MGCIVAVLRAEGWDVRHLLVQTACGLCVPFNQPRMPGRANLPLMLTLYLGALPLGKTVLVV
jgi:hypothetical protein